MAGAALAEGSHWRVIAALGRREAPMTVEDGETVESVPGSAGLLRRRGGRRRHRVEGGRPNKFTIRFTDEELEAVALKAAAARMSVPHFVALRALETPRGGGMDLAELQSWAVEMMNLRRGVRRTGQNVNQIARLLNGTGEVGRHAEESLVAVTEALRALDPLVEWMAQASGLVEP
jgi:Bacterial mobilisation protein (MobC)